MSRHRCNTWWVLAAIAWIVLVMVVVATHDPTPLGGVPG